MLPLEKQLRPIGGFGWPRRRSFCKRSRNEKRSDCGSPSGRASGYGTRGPQFESPQGAGIFYTYFYPFFFFPSSSYFFITRVSFNKSLSVMEKLTLILTKDCLAGLLGAKLAQICTDRDFKKLSDEKLKWGIILLLLRRLVVICQENIWFLSNR